jgi:enamine deaminase RidA (YjgF/YER057c/UK114 family)
VKEKYTSGLAMEEQFGYSRAVSAGNTLYVSATAPVTPEIELIGSGSYEQSLAVYDRLVPVFQKAGYEFSDIVQVRVLLADLDGMLDVARALKERLGDARPALSIVHVVPYSLEGMLLEIEVTAVREEAR